MSHYHSSSSTSRNNVPSAVRLASIGRIFIILVFFLFSWGGSVARVSAATTITFTGEELLGKPEATSITVNIIPASTIEYHYQYGTISGSYSGQTATVTATSGQPSEVVISGLTANTRYYYRMRYHLPEETDWVERTEHFFWTQRAQGSTFKFTVTSDSHATFNTNHQQAMTNILSDQPDFHLDLGDTFYPASGTTTQAAVNNAYLAYRDPLYMDRIGHSVPIFLASGNHEEEEGWNLDDTPFSIGVGSIQARKAYFPTPTNGGFYSGNTDPLAAIDEATYGDEYREDYYAWTWGDALFVVIDEFQYTMNLPYTPAAGEGSDDPVTGDQWSWTLGQQQYNWLKQTLENSNAKYKFVFSHNMLGGVPRTVVGVGAGYVRGGAEAAGYFEWGGQNASGTDEFATKRPGWDMTIHEMFVAYGVSAYFHGHDHQYVYETRDGIVYQEVPSPSMDGSGFSGIYTEGTFGTYETIKKLPSTGHLRVTVALSQATVEYVRSNGGDSYTYTIAPNTPPVTHDLTMAADPVGGGTTDPAVGVHTYNENTVVDITATPALGYGFDYWSGACSGSDACQVTMDANKSVTAHFKTVPTYVLTTAVSPDGAGTISPSAGAHTYNQGAVVNVTAAPAAGYVFNHWSGACTGADPNACSVTMDADKSVTAHFAVKTTLDLTVAVDPAGGGTADPAAGIHRYAAGSVVSVTAAPAAGYAFDHWSGACTGSGCCTVTMDADKTVTANFAAAVSHIADIGSATIKDSSVTDLVITTSAAVAAGDAIVIAYATDPTQDLNLVVSDSVGNKYQQAGMAISSGNARTYIFAAYNVTALPLGGTITINQTVYSTTAVAARAAVVSVFRGLASEGALEQTNNGNGTGSTTPSSGAATTVQPVQLLIGAVGTEGPGSDTAGTWSNSFTIGPRAGTTATATDAEITVSMGWRIVTAAGNYTAAKSGITSRDYAAVIATFKTTDAGISYIGDVGRAQSKTAGTSLAVTTNAAVAAGDDILVAFAADEEGAVGSVVDTVGNTYVQAATVTNDPTGTAAGVRTQLYAAYNVTAVPSGSTITINHASVTARSAVASAFRGLDSSAVLDKTSTGTGASTSPSSGATSTTTQADELLIGAVGAEGPNVDAPGVWANSFTDGPRLGTSYGAASGDATDITVGLGWRIVGATGGYTAARSIGTSRDWAAAIATFKADYRLTVAVDPAGGATTVPAVGVHTYPKGAVVSVTPTPGTGYVFDHWSGACTGAGMCSVTMGADKSVTAHFTVSVDVTITKPGSNPVLTWPHQATAVNLYTVYRSLTAPYFTPSVGSRLPSGDVPPVSPQTTLTDSTAVLTVAGNTYFYLVGPVNGCGGACGSSNRTGAFVFGLVPGN